MILGEKIFDTYCEQFLKLWLQTSVNNNVPRHAATDPLLESPASGDRSLHSLFPKNY